jgi:hypothetical protein
MILEAAEHITQILNSPGITAEIGTNIFWELAEEKTKYPFLTFTVDSPGPASKSGLNEFNLQVRIFAVSLHEAARISGVIKNEIKNNPAPWRDRGTRSGYTDADAKEGFIELTYNFKL